MGSKAAAKRPAPSSVVPRQLPKRAKTQQSAQPKETQQVRRSTNTSSQAKPQVKAKQLVKCKGMSPKDLKAFEAKRELLQSWTNDKMKALLKANDQSRSGNKAVLMAKCADGMAFGKLPRCPKCFGGKIKFRLPGADKARV